MDIDHRMMCKIDVERKESRLFRCPLVGSLKYLAGWDLEPWKETKVSSCRSDRDLDDD